MATRVQESSASSSLSRAWSHIEKESSPGIWAQGQLITMGTAEQVGGRQQGWCGQAQGPWGWLWLLSWVPLPQPLAGWAGHRKCWKSAGLGADLYAASCFHLTDGENKTKQNESPRPPHEQEPDHSGQQAQYRVRLHAGREGAQGLPSPGNQPSSGVTYPPKCSPTVTSAQLRVPRPVPALSGLTYLQKDCWSVPGPSTMLEQEWGMVTCGPASSARPEGPQLHPVDSGGHA